MLLWLLKAEKDSFLFFLSLPLVLALLCSQMDWTKGKGVAKLQLRDARKDESVLLQICIELDTCREQTECSFNRF